MKKTLTFSILILLLIAAGAYWYFFLGPGRPQGLASGQNPGSSDQGGFHPFGNTTPFSGGPNSTSTADTEGGTATSTPAKLPTLRLLSGMPVGGYGVLVAKATTTVHWIDRGRGNVYEATYDSADITTLSNTLVPRTYESVWSKDLNSFIGSLFQSGQTAPTTVYAQLTPRTASADSSTPYSLHGKNLPSNIIGYASSPDKSKLFMLIDEGGVGAGYVSSFNGQNTVKIFSTPLTQVSVEWPADNTIAITTNGSAGYAGYMYFVNPKTGAWTKEIGPLPGLSTRVSHDGKYVIASFSGNRGLVTNIYSLGKSTGTDAVIRTLADKCAWGNFYKEMVYCGVPTQLPTGTYPDDWYTGRVTTVDKVWQVNASTGEVHLVSSIIDQADRSINAFNLSLDSADGYLFFMNKNDLSLWSLDLVQSN